MNGISALKRLEVLSMQFLEIETTEHLINLFNLSNLKFLDISDIPEYDSCIIVHLYVECGKGLPNLKFMDCTATDINNDLLEKILISHPKLETISAIVTNLHRVSDSGVCVLQTDAIDSAVTSLIQCSRLNLHYLAEKCFYEIRDLLESGQHFNASEFLRKIINLIETSSCPIRKKHGISYLIELAEHQCQKLTLLEVSILLDTLLNQVLELPEIDDYLSENKSYNISMWCALDNLTNSENHHFNYDKICWVAVKYLVTKPNSRETRAVEVLEKYFNSSMSRIWLISIARQNNFMKRIVNILGRGLGRNEKYVSVLNILTPLVECCDEACHNLVEHYGHRILLVDLKDCEDETAQLKILYISVQLTRFQNYEMLKIFHDDLFFSDIKKMPNRWEDNRAYQAFSFLAQLQFLSESHTFPRGFWSSVDTMMIDCFKKILENCATFDIHEFFFTRGIIQNILKTSKCIGPVLWALLTIEVLIVQKKDLTWNISRSELLECIEHIRVEKGIVRRMTSNIIEMLNSC